MLKSFVYHDEITLCQYVTYLTLPQKVALGHADSPIKQSSQHAIHALTVILLLFTCWQAAAWRQSSCYFLPILMIYITYHPAPLPPVTESTLEWGQHWSQLAPCLHSGKEPHTALRTRSRHHANDKSFCDLKKSRRYDIYSLAHKLNFFPNHSHSNDIKFLSPKML